MATLPERPPEPASLGGLLLARCRWVWLAVFLFSQTINGLMLVSSVYMMQVMDRVLTSGSLATLAGLTVLAVGALAVLAVLDVLRARVLVRVSAWIERALSPTVYRRVMEAALDGRGTGTEPLGDLATVRGFLGGSGLLTLFDVPAVPIYLGCIYLLHPVLGHVALGGAVLLAGLAVLNDRAAAGPIRQAGIGAGSNMRWAEAGLRNAEVADAMGMLPQLTERWAAGSARVSALQSSASNRAALVMGLSKFTRLVIQTAILGTGAMLAVEHAIGASAMIAASIMLGRGLAPLEQAVGLWKQATQARHAYRRLSDFLARPPRRPAAMPLAVEAGELSVEEAVYRLPDGRPLLRGVSFGVRPGEALAVVGPSGAGKSTLTRLLVGCLRLDGGTIRLDGGDVFQWDRDSFGRAVGYLPQDIELFAGSIRHNIARLGAAGPEQVVEAARLAQVHELILRLPQGYDTEIGEHGARLSAGQRQRIALARAFFGRPRLIVLDEPNANLDSEGEEALNRAIAAAKDWGAAVVMVGHRPGLLSQADRILVLNNGRVERIGPSQEILSRITRRATPLRPAPEPALAAAGE